MAKQNRYKQAETNRPDKTHHYCHQCLHPHCCYYHLQYQGDAVVMQVGVLRVLYYHLLQSQLVDVDIEQTA